MKNCLKLFCIGLLSLWVCNSNALDLNGVLKNGSDDVGPDDRGGGSGGGSSTKLKFKKTKKKSKLSSCCGVTTEKHKGKLEYEADSKKARIKSSVKVNLPSSYPVVDTSSAPGESIVLQITRGSNLIYECSLAYDKIVTDDDGRVYAEYKLDLESKIKKGEIRTRNKKGSCVSTYSETELDGSNLVKSIASVQKGDVLAVKNREGETDSQFLVGLVK